MSAAVSPGPRNPEVERGDESDMDEPSVYEVGNSCEDGTSLNLTLASMRASSIDEDTARHAVLKKVFDQVSADCVKKNWLCEAACGPGQKCVLDVDPSIEAKITCKPGLSYNPATKKLDSIYVCTFAGGAIKVACLCTEMA